MIILLGYIINFLSSPSENQNILDEERLTFKFLDVITILLNYCGPKLATENDDKEMKAVIRDLIIIIGYFCANNKHNQVLEL
jgi:hypothetical protein